MIYSFLKFFFDFCIAPFVDATLGLAHVLPAAAPAPTTLTTSTSSLTTEVQGCSPCSTLSRMRISLFKYQLLHKFLTSLTQHAIASPNANTQILATCFIESALALGINFA